MSGQSLERGRAGRRLVVAMLMIATVVGLAGVDLILPAIPDFPRLFGSTPEMGQGVIAGYVGGYALGLFLFGVLADHIQRRILMVAALFGFVLTSLALSVGDQAGVVLAMRALQGACAAAPAVFTPAIIKAVFDEAGAIKAIGLLSSVESLAPAFAPVLGLFLYQAGGWSLSFGVLAILGGFTVLGLTLMRHLVPERSAQPSPSRAATYQRLLVHWPFMSHALSQAASMGAILVFVFAAPVIITQSLGGEPYHFIIMQLLGISGFIAAANASSVLGRKLGVRRLILIGSGMVVLACLALVGLALTGLQSVVLMIVVFIPFNLGLGLRGPSGFLWAMQASEGGDDRAASLIILFAMGLAALGTAIIARYLEIGLLVPALACALITGLALALFISAPTPKS